jgi:hypothetical protein
MQNQNEKVMTNKEITNRIERYESTIQKLRAKNADLTDKIDDFILSKANNSFEIDNYESTVKKLESENSNLTNSLEELRTRSDLLLSLSVKEFVNIIEKLTLEKVKLSTEVEKLTLEKIKSEEDSLKCRYVKMVVSMEDGVKILADLKINMTSKQYEEWSQSAEALQLCSGPDNVKRVYYQHRLKMPDWFVLKYITYF